MVGGNISSQMGMCLKVNIKMENHMDMVKEHLQIKMFSKENLKMELEMERGVRRLRMEISLKESM